MAQEPGVDPRYDPAFQRGFTTGAPATATPAPHVESALQRPTRTVHPRPDSPRPPQLEVIGMPPASQEETERVGGETVVAVAQPELRPPWTNPFVVALAVIGVLVLAASGYFFAESIGIMDETNGFQTQADYWRAQVLMIGTPIAVGLGIAILAGVLFFCAAWWSRRPRRSSDED